MEGQKVLMSVEQLLHLNICPECNKLCLLLNPALDDIPVFCQSVQTLQGIAILADQVLPYLTLLPWVKKVDALTGFQQIACLYSL